MPRPTTDAAWDVVVWSEQAARLAIRERSQGRCELRLPGCYGDARNVSHRIPRGQGGRWTPANGLDACGSGTTGCHGTVEHERDDAYVCGMLVRRGQDPATVPVRLRHPVYGPAWWQPTDAGLLVWVDPYETERTAA